MPSRHRREFLDINPYMRDISQDFVAMLVGRITNTIDENNNIFSEWLYFSIRETLKGHCLFQCCP